MENDIIKDFLKDSNVQNLNNINDIKIKYEQFKQSWMGKMVENMIQSLDINDEGAREVRKNP